MATVTITIQDRIDEYGEEVTVLKYNSIPKMPDEVSSMTQAQILGQEASATIQDILNMTDKELHG